MQNSTLEQKYLKVFCSELSEYTEDTKTKPTKEIGTYNKSGDEFMLFICSVYEKRRHIH